MHWAEPFYRKKKKERNKEIGLVKKFGGNELFSMFIFFPEKRLLSSLSNFPSLRSLSNRIYCLRRFHGDEAWRQTSGSYRWVRKKWLQCSAEDQVARYLLQGRRKASRMSLPLPLYISMLHSARPPMSKTIA